MTRVEIGDKEQGAGAGSGSEIVQGIVGHSSRGLLRGGDCCLFVKICLGLELRCRCRFLYFSVQVGVMYTCLFLDHNGIVYMHGRV